MGNEAPGKMLEKGNGDVTTRHLRAERLLVTTFRGHVTARLAEDSIQAVSREVPVDMPKDLRPLMWIVDALQVTGFDGQEIRKPGGRLLMLVRERIAPHMILLRVENESVFQALGQAAVILFARGITFGNGVKLHVLSSMSEVVQYIDHLRSKGELK